MTLVEEAAQRQVSYYKRDRIDLAASIPLPRPLHYQFNITNACNMKCFFCPVSLDDYAKLAGGLTHMGMDDYKMALGQMQELGRAKVLSYYLIGESFVNPNFIPMLKLAKEANVADIMTATTNASLLTEKKWGPLCDSGLDMLRCSIMGTDEEKYKERGNSGVTMAKVMTNISGLKQYRDSHGYKTPHICLRTHTTTKEEADEFKSKFGGIGDELFVDFLFDWSGSMGKDEQGRGLFSKVTDEEMYRQTNFFGDPTKQKKCCPYPFYVLIVLSDMKVTICSVDWNHLNTVGDLRKETLSQIWHGEKIKEFRRMHLQHRRCSLSACSACGFIHNTKDSLDHLTESVLGGEPKRMDSWSPVT